MEVEQLPDGRALAALSLAELREACGSRGLSKGGSRKDLHDRLKIRLELEKLREESSRKAKAKEDVVPNIGLQDTAVGQSDVVRQYLEAQQRRLERFAQFGQTTGVPHQQLSQPAEQHPHQHQQSQQQLRLLHQQTPPTAATTTTTAAAAATTTIPTPGYIAHVPIAPSPVPPSLGLNHSSAHLGRSSSSGGHGLSQAERVSSGGSSRAIAPAEVARTKATGMSTRKGKNASLAASVGSDFVLPSACTAVEPPALFVADDESSPSSSPLLLSQTAVTAAAGPAKPELPSPTTGSRTTSKATRSRLANKTTKPEVLLQPSPAKKTRLNSALEAAAVAAAAAAAVSATEITSDEALRPSSSDGVVAIADDQLVPTLAPLTAAKRRRGALRQSSPALAGGSKGEALPMAVKSSPRAVRGAQAQPEPHGLASPKANIAATKEKPASVEVRRSRGRPRKTFGGDVSTMAVAGAPSTEAVLTDEPEIAAKSIGDSPTGTETGVGGSSVRERGKERERILDNAKPSKLDKIANTTDNWAAVAPETMANAEAATTTLTSTTTIASSASLSSASKSPKVSEEKHPSSVADLLRSGKESVVVAVKSKDASVTKRSERSANRNEAQAEQLKESRESRSTRGKRLRSHDDVAVAQTTVSPGNETSRKLNKANRHKERTSKIDASAPSKDAKDQTLEDVSTMERDSSPHVEDPIEAALLALHGGCEDPPVSAPSSAARQPSPRAAPESPTQIHQAPLRSSVKGRGTSLREDKHGTLSVADRPVVATKSSAVVVSEMSPHRTCATAPSKLAENKANPSTVPEETPTPAEDIVTSEGAKELSFVKPESELLLKPTASSSSNLDRSEIRRSERNPRETRKRSKVENIVQRLARRGNGRYSNASTSPSSESNNSSSSNVHVQAAALREPIVLLERTELSSLPTASEDVADVRPLASSDQVIPPTKTPTSDHELASRMSPEEDWSSGSNPMPASRTLNASDEKGSLPIDSERTMPTSPRSKRARRENGAVSDQGGDSAEGDASNGPVLSAARSGSEGETGQVKFGTALGSTTSLSPDECVMRLLGVLSSPPVEPRLPLASTVCSTPMSANAFKDDSRQQELKERPPPPEQQHQQHWQEQQSKCPRQRTSSSSSERSESKRSKRKASTEHLGSPADYSDPVSALLSTEGKHQMSSSKCSSSREALTEVLPTVAPSDAAKSSGRRDSIEAAVAALIGEPYEEDVPPALPVESVSSRKPDVGHIDREPVAESQSLVPRSRTGSSSEKKYSTPSAALSSASSSSSLLSSVKSDRSSRHKDDRRKHERERKASASSGGRGVKSSSGSRSSRSRSSRSSKIDESSSRSTPPASAAQVMEGQAKREEVIGGDDNDVLKDEGSTPLTKKVSSPSADGSEMLLAAGGGGIASEKRQPSGLDKDVSETTSTTEQTTDEAASQSVTKTEIGDTKKATKNAGDSTSDSVSVTGRSEELLGGNSTAHPAPEGSDSSDEAVLSSAQSIVKVGSRAPRSDPFLADSARGDLCLVAKVESTKVDTISQHDAVADVGESVASPSSLLVAKSKINRSAAPPSEPVKDSARLVNAVKTNENVSKTKEATFRGVTSLETPQVGAIATAELRKVDESPLATDSPKEAKSDETSMASIGEASQAPKTKETETSTVQERNLSDLERPAEERDLMKAQTASPATSEARPIDPADTEVPAEEDVCLILGDADDDADEDDVPTICMAQTSNQGASSSLAIEPKITPSVSERAVDDDTPIVADIASAIEQETSAAGNVSGAGDPDDLWEAVFCADHDQNAALERSVWNEAENNSHRTTTTTPPQFPQLESSSGDEFCRRNSSRRRTSSFASDIYSWS